MTTLTQRGRNANNAARLPALASQTQVTDVALRNFLEGVREYLEVRLGSRGDYFERAVTFRDLDPLIAELDARLNALEALGSSTFDPSDLQRQINQLRADIQYLRSQLLLVEENYKSITLQLNSQVGGDTRLRVHSPNAVLLLHCEPDPTTGALTFVDSSPTGATITVHGDARLLPGEKVWDTHGFMNATRTGVATGNYIEADLGGAGVMTGDFTIDMWVKGGGNNVVFYESSGAYLYNDLFQGYGGSNIPIYTNLNSTEWHWLAISRTGSTISAYTDGIRTGTATYSSTVTLDVLRFGVYSPGGNLNWLGYYDEIHVANGVGMYSGTSVAVPYGPYYV